MKPNMIFVIIKGSVEQATTEAARRGMTLYQASKSPKWNETLGYVSMEYEYQALKRVTEWMNEWGELNETGGYSPGTLLWYAVAESKTVSEREAKETTN